MAIYTDGNRVEFEQETNGCKATSTISLPDIVLLGNEFVGNIDMTGDGNIGGEKLLFEKVCITQIKSTKKRNISKLLGLQNYLVNLFVALESLKARDNYLILGLELIHLRIQLEMRVTDKNTFTLI